MKPIAIFYHAIFSGGTIPVDTSFACSIMREQMSALKRSGLMDQADEMHVGVNGDEGDAAIARMLIPRPSVKFTAHGPHTTTEIPTLNVLRNWLPGHEDWRVMYHHLKGVTHPGEALYEAWRRRLEKAVVWGWRSCIADMDRGIDSCGAHWLTREQFPNLVHGPPFWGGTFWWATANYLLTLPPLPPATWANRFEAEHWIGKSPQRARVRDYCPGWP